MNKAQFIDKISSKTSFAKSDIERILDAALEIIQDCVSTNEDIKLVGFGTFSQKQRAARVGRNPKSGEMFKIAEDSVPHFKAGKEFKEKVSKKRK